MSLLSNLFFLSCHRKHQYRGNREGIELFVSSDTEAWDRTVGYDTEAYCFGTNILFRSDEEYNDPTVWKHEREHVRQMLACGGEGVFRPAYLLSSMIAKMRWGDPTRNRFEREAHAAEKL